MKQTDAERWLQELLLARRGRLKHHEQSQRMRELERSNRAMYGWHLPDNVAWAARRAARCDCGREGWR